MPRLPRTPIPGLPHHVTQRGNNRQDVFFTDEDRLLYLNILGANAKKFGLTIIGYCLMTNHLHLLVIPGSEDSLAKAIGRTNWRYTQDINRLHGRSGHLWQGRFFSCALDEPHALQALAYIELNPIRAKLVKDPLKYAWSSAGAHAGSCAPPPWLDMTIWSRWTDSERWKNRLKRALPAALETEELRSHTRRGRPLGSDSFLAKMESIVGHRLRPLPVGRPKKDPAGPAEKP